MDLVMTKGFLIGLMRRCGFLRHALSAGMLYAGQIWSAQSLSMILSSASFRFAGRTHGFLKREW
jgi:hypothetical protein